MSSAKGIRHCLSDLRSTAFDSYAVMHETDDLYTVLRCCFDFLLLTGFSLLKYILWIPFLSSTPRCGGNVVTF